MKIIGLSERGSNSVAFLEDGVIQLAVEEERFIRQKAVSIGIPVTALKCGLEYLIIDNCLVTKKRNH